MKCFACGYEKKNDEYDKIDFIELNLKTELSINNNKEELDTEIKGYLGYGKREPFYLYVCPECGTVRAE